MLAASAEPTTQFTRRDAGRLFAASAVLVLAMSVILGIDFLPAQPLLEAGRPAPELVQAPRTDEYPSDVLTKQQRDAASAAILPRYDFTSEGAAPSPRSSCASSTPRSRPSTPRSRTRSPPRAGRPSSSRSCPGSAPRSGPPSRASMRSAGTRCGPRRRACSRPSSEPSCATARSPRSATRSRGAMAGDLNADERALAAALIGPLVAPNSSFSAASPTRRRRAPPRTSSRSSRAGRRARSIVRVGDRVDDVAFEAIERFGVNQGGLDVARLGRLARPVVPRHRPPARLDLALPARVLASQQRAAAAEPAAARSRCSRSSSPPAARGSRTSLPLAAVGHAGHGPARRRRRR